MRVKILKKIRQKWFVSDRFTGVVNFGFRFTFIKKDYSKDYIIDGFNSINKFCLDNGIYGYDQYSKYELKKQIRNNHKKYN